ncbi:hypothetical protein LZC95_19970 [Pendulispora brunnea]|uniref:Uncharacterized protein n=1 Tax=Pendulispora brunnea TaxID=2905690 RepID=A0ABZ2KK87_9BACT
MGNFQRTFSDAVWNGAGFIVPATAFEDFERKLAAGVSGEGGAYAPTAPITIAGAGMTVRPVVVRGARGRVRVASNGAFVIASGLPELGPDHVGRTRICTTPCLLGWTDPLGMAFLRREMCSVQFFATQFLNPQGRVVRAQMFVPLRVCDGGLITKAVLTFRVSTPHATPPSTTVSVRILRADAGGYTVPLTSTRAGADADGFVAYVPAPSSGSAWFDGGAVKELVAPCDQNHRVDLGRYHYLAHIVDEQGSVDSPLMANLFAPVGSVSRFGNFNTGPYYSSDVPKGQRILLTAQTDPRENGVWYFVPKEPPTGNQDAFYQPANDGAGDPRPAVATVGDVDSHHGLYTRWYLPAPGVPQEPKSAPQRWTSEPDAAGGNIFHAVTLEHTDVGHLGFT